MAHVAPMPYSDALGSGLALGSISLALSVRIRNPDYPLPFRNERHGSRYVCCEESPRPLLLPSKAATIPLYKVGSGYLGRRRGTRGNDTSHTAMISDALGSDFRQTSCSESGTVVRPKAPRLVLRTSQASPDLASLHLLNHPSNHASSDIRHRAQRERPERA